MKTSQLLSTVASRRDAELSEGRAVECRLTSILRHLVGLQIRLDRLVLLVELSHVGYEVLDDVHCEGRIRIGETSHRSTLRREGRDAL